MIRRSYTALYRVYTQIQQTGTYFDLYQIIYTYVDAINVVIVVLYTCTKVFNCTFDSGISSYHLYLLEWQLKTGMNMSKPMALYKTNTIYNTSVYHYKKHTDLHGDFN